MNTLHDMCAILGDDFFKEEVRCDYLVSEQMKQIWAIEIDLYLTFVEVCNKYSLRYFVGGGTLIGAVRHKGFIPWDDDFDVYMPREDYNAFMNISQTEFTHPIFLQTPYTDPGYYVSWIKLRNTESTCLSPFTKHQNFNQGIFLDIFPIDDCDMETAEEISKQIYIYTKKCGVAMRMGCEFLNERQKADAIKYATNNPLQDWECIQELASTAATSDAENYGLFVFTGTPIKKLSWKKIDYSHNIIYPFETIEIPVPVGYDNILKATYGDYMQFPPVELRGARHSDMIFDPFHPFTYYKNK